MTTKIGGAMPPILFGGGASTIRMVQGHLIPNELQQVHLR